jgi:hypothetical protein
VFPKNNARARYFDDPFFVEQVLLLLDQGTPGGAKMRRLKKA